VCLCVKESGHTRQAMYDLVFFFNLRLVKVKEAVPPEKPYSLFFVSPSPSLFTFFFFYRRDVAHHGTKEWRGLSFFVRVCIFLCKRRFPAFFLSFRWVECLSGQRDFLEERAEWSGTLVCHRVSIWVRRTLFSLTGLSTSRCLRKRGEREKKNREASVLPGGNRPVLFFPFRLQCQRKKNVCERKKETRN
jgi:hypothetical protein